jgi:citrate synthase
MTAVEAAALLGVKTATLYAYASRGWLRSRASPGTRSKHYDRADVLRLKERAAARHGRTAVAKDALDFGAPVVSTSITAITDDGPRYRGHDPRDLLRSNEPFATCAALLANDSGTEMDGAVLQAANDIARHVLELAVSMRPRTLLQAVDVVLTAWRLRLTHVGSAAREQCVRRVLLSHVCAAPGLLQRPVRFVADVDAPSATLRAALALANTAEVNALLGTTLVVLADHELNASTFVARVTASTGAATPACLAAALAAVSGPRHGATCERVEAMLDEITARRSAFAVVADRIARGEPVMGFGHRLYPRGDPRASWLLAQRTVQSSAAARSIFDLVDALQDLVGVGPLSMPAVEPAVVAASRALGLPAGTASGLFAIARCAGWLAHIAEQRQSGKLLRPRAEWVAP